MTVPYVLKDFISDLEAVVANETGQWKIVGAIEWYADHCGLLALV